jgi:hypothetical protein
MEIALFTKLHPAYRRRASAIGAWVPKIIRSQEHRHISDRQTGASISEVTGLLAKRCHRGIAVGASQK